MDINRHIIASEGTVLTNGEIYAAELWLGQGDTITNWREISKEEAALLQDAVADGEAYNG